MGPLHSIPNVLCRYPSMPISSSDRILSQNLLEPTIRLLRALAAWRMAEIQHDWARQQSRLMAVASSPLYLGGRSNSLLRGPDYLRYYGLRHT